jgi:hypothetical protein
MAQQLSHASRTAIEDLQSRRERIVSGGVRVFRAYQHPVDDDERVSVQPVVVSCKDAPESSWPSAIPRPRRPDGQLWVTDRRVVLAHGSQIRKQWLWSELRDVRIIAGYTGVVLVPADGDTVAVIEKVNKDPVLMPRLTPVRRWLTIEATYANARGRLDEWYAELPARMAKT